MKVTDAFSGDQAHLCYKITQQWNKKKILNFPTKQQSTIKFIAL